VLVRCSDAEPHYFYAASSSTINKMEPWPTQYAPVTGKHFYQGLPNFVFSYIGKKIIENMP
jgi:hypothetical protein